MYLPKPSQIISLFRRQLQNKGTQAPEEAKKLFLRRCLRYGLLFPQKNSRKQRRIKCKEVCFCLFSFKSSLSDKNMPCFYFPEIFHITAERTAQTTATQTQMVFTILLKSRKPLPVVVAAQTAAKIAITTKIMLIILKIVFFSIFISFSCGSNPACYTAASSRSFWIFFERAAFSAFSSFGSSSRISAAAFLASSRSFISVIISAILSIGRPLWR